MSTIAANPVSPRTREIYNLHLEILRAYNHSDNIHGLAMQVIGKPPSNDKKDSSAIRLSIGAMERIIELETRINQLTIEFLKGNGDLSSLSRALHPNDETKRSQYLQDLPVLLTRTFLEQCLLEPADPVQGEDISQLPKIVRIKLPELAKILYPNDEVKQSQYLQEMYGLYL